MLTAITCPGCGEKISIGLEFPPVAECGGDGEGTCDACFDESAPDMLRAIAAAQHAAAVSVGSI